MNELYFFSLFEIFVSSSKNGTMILHYFDSLIINQWSVIILNTVSILRDCNSVLEYQKDFRVMLIFQYFLIIFIKMVESGICDDQVDQARIHGATHRLVIYSNLPSGRSYFKRKLPNLEFSNFPWYKLHVSSLLRRFVSINDHRTWFISNHPSQNRKA